MLLSPRTFRHLAALVLGGSALFASAPALAQEESRGQTESGFALEANVGARFFLIDAGTVAGIPSVALPEVGLVAGYKTGRIFLGLGLDFANNTSNTTQATGIGGGTVSATTSESIFLIGPDFQVALLRTSDQRVELLGDISLHFGHAFASVTTTPATPPNNTPTDSNFLLTYALGTGVRYWAHPHLALQVLTGFGGQAFFDLPVNGNPATGNNSQHGIFTSFGVLGVF
jgi:hypothetical protein